MKYEFWIQTLGSDLFKNFNLNLGKYTFQRITLVIFRSDK